MEFFNLIISVRHPIWQEHEAKSVKLVVK